MLLAFVEDEFQISFLKWPTERQPFFYWFETLIVKSFQTIWVGGFVLGLKCVASLRFVWSVLSKIGCLALPSLPF